MSDERHETVADIMSEMREYADSMEKHDLYDLRECATDYLRVLSDRIEDAVNRENRTVEKSSVVGNAAAMREALVIVKRLFDGRLMWQPDIRKAHEAVNAALSAPPRNCDVGTAEEQAERFYAFCGYHRFQSGIKGMCSSLCPCIRCRDMCNCITTWSQMPYDEGGAK